MKNENAKAVVFSDKTLGAMCTQAKTDSTGIASHIVGKVGTRGGAEAIYNDLMTMRSMGGIVALLSRKIQALLTHTFGYVPRYGDDPATIADVRTPKFRKELAGKEWSEMWKIVIAKGITGYYDPNRKEKKEKELDPKGQALKLIGNWNSQLICFIATHKQEIEELRKATPKS